MSNYFYANKHPSDLSRYVLEYVEHNYERAKFFWVIGRKLTKPTSQVIF